MRYNRRSLGVAIVAIALLLTSSIAGATGVSLLAGSTAVSSSTFAFTALGTLSLAGTNTATGSDPMTITDDRGSGAGWNVKVSATDFVATGITDPTVGAATLTVTLPIASVLTASAGSLTSTQGQDATNITVASSATPVTSAGISLYSAATGNGMGVYTSTIAHTFTLPKTVAASGILSSDATTSTFKTGHTRAASVFAGTYNSTITYTISNAP